LIDNGTVPHPGRSARAISPARHEARAPALGAGGSWRAWVDNVVCRTEVLDEIARCAEAEIAERVEVEHVLVRAAHHRVDRVRDDARPRDLSHVAEGASSRARDGDGFGTNGTNGTGHARASEQAVGGGAWDAPDLSLLGTGRRPAPEFPLPLVGQFWAGWVERHAAVASAPVDYVAVLLLACMGSMLANVRWPVAGAGWSEPPVLWCGPRSGNRIKRAATPIVTATEMRLF
jgi:hypothetical protein